MSVETAYDGYKLLGMKSVRKRAGQACVACNAKRIKCNLTTEHPCGNCSRDGLSCRPRVSRRGKHVRRLGAGLSASSPPNHGPAQGGLDELAASQVLANLPYTRRLDDNLGAEASNSVQDTSPGTEEHIPEASSVFLGESTALRYVHTGSGSIMGKDPPSSLKLLHPLPTAIQDYTHIPEWESERRQNKVKALEAEGVFSFPDARVVETLLQYYFDKFHSCFSILDEPEVWSNLGNGTLSPLLLNAMLFISVIYSDEEVIKGQGLVSRAHAKYAFYHRAKDIYDAGYEQCKTIIIQSVFLMSFWRDGPLLEKDARHWLSISISLSQGRALHRLTDSADSSAKRIEKRLWWSIYIRERQCSAALGLPSRIRDEDCDIGPLKVEDFENGFTRAGDCTALYIEYQIRMSSLAKLLGRIIDAGYLPGKTLAFDQKVQLKDELLLWRRQVPLILQLDGDLQGTPSLHASMLHLAYNNLVILLHRPGFVDELRLKTDENISVQAAARNSRIIEDVLSEGVLCFAQVHVITNLFNTLCIHVIQLRRATASAITIAEHHANICILGLQELQKTWEVRNWILQLFYQYLDQSTAMKLRIRGQNIRGLGNLESLRGPSCHQSRRASLSRDPVGQAHRHGANSSDGRIQTDSRMDTPCQYPTEEQTELLFSELQDKFAFGEGEFSGWKEGFNAASLFSSEDLGDVDMAPCLAEPTGDTWHI